MDPDLKHGERATLSITDHEKASSLRSSDPIGNKKLNNLILIKRLLDIVLSGIALILLAIPLLIIAIAIRLESKGPALFRQERMAKNAQPFRIFKFRTMKLGAEKETMGVYIDGENPYITRLGHWLRRWGLDELPQLLNVLRGDMSLVGPRPALRYQVEKYNERQMLRLKVKPGLTGWAQVNGRNKLNWPQRIEYDVWYVEHWSLQLDAKISLLTPIAVLRRDFAFADDVPQDNIVRPL